MADTAAHLYSWSTTLGSNLPTDSTTIGTNFADNLQTIQQVMRYELATRATTASATTCDIGAVDAGTQSISGTTTITGLGTVSAGIRRRLVFEGILTLTYNATSLILPTSASITTAAGDWAEFESLGSGNWVCLWYMRKNGQPIAAATTFADGTVSAPGITFTSDLDNGLYRIGTNNWGLTAGGVKVLDMAADALTLQAGTANGGLVFASTGGATLTARKGVALTLAGANNSGSQNGSSVTITAGNMADGGGGFVRGDVTITAGNQTFTSGSSGDRGGDVTITGGTATDPTTAAISGIVRLRAGNVGSAATPGSVRLQDGAGTDLLVASANRKTIAVGGAAPTVASGGGTSPSVAGKTNAFKVTMGATGSPSTTLVIDLPTPVQGTGAFASAPVVVVNYETADLRCWATATTTQVTVTFASAPANNGVLHVICLGYE